MKVPPGHLPYNVQFFLGCNNAQLRLQRGREFASSFHSHKTRRAMNSLS